MRNILNQIRARVDKPSIETEVDQELRFHLDMQALDYEHRGLSPAESRARQTDG